MDGAAGAGLSGVGSSQQVSEGGRLGVLAWVWRPSDLTCGPPVFVALGEVADSCQDGRCRVRLDDGYWAGQVHGSGRGG